MVWTMDSALPLPTVYYLLKWFEILSSPIQILTCTCAYLFWEFLLCSTGLSIQRLISTVFNKYSVIISEWGLVLYFNIWKFPCFPGYFCLDIFKFIKLESTNFVMFLSPLIYEHDIYFHLFNCIFSLQVFLMHILPISCYVYTKYF